MTRREQILTRIREAQEDFERAKGRLENLKSGWVDADVKKEDKERG